MSKICSKFNSEYKIQKFKIGDRDKDSIKCEICGEELLS
jgi:hypothetical protein